MRALSESEKHYLEAFTVGAVIALAIILISVWFGYMLYR
jgi:hypothetical protein